MVPQPRSPTQTLVVDETIHEERGDSVERDATTATSLDAKHIKKVKKLEKRAKSSQARRRARIVVFDDEDDLEDPSKQGRKIAAIDQDPGISLIYTEGTRKYWKIIRVGNHTEVHHFFDDMLTTFDRDDLVMLWSLVKEKFNLTEPTDDKEREI
ncbi:hypothetical protein Tco_1415843 [Tanacetum coccineum]